MSNVLSHETKGKLNLLYNSHFYYFVKQKAERLKELVVRNTVKISDLGDERKKSKLSSQNVEQFKSYIDLYG